MESDTFGMSGVQHRSSTIRDCQLHNICRHILFLCDVRKGQGEVIKAHATYCLRNGLRENQVGIRCREMPIKQMTILAKFGEALAVQVPISIATEGSEHLLLS
jgi:hypothetical protein